MIMDPMRLKARDELDRDILSYVREMQKIAPVTAESITEFEQTTRRRRVRADEVRDRLDYLESAGYLVKLVIWEGGETENYKITADGVDLLDGAAPPRGWKGTG